MRACDTPASNRPRVLREALPFFPGSGSAPRGAPRSYAQPVTPPVYLVAAGTHAGAVNPLAIILPLAIGIPLVVGTTLFVVFTMVARTTRRAREALEQEGVVLDSSSQWITVRMNKFRRQGRYTSNAISKGRGYVVFTRQALVVLSGSAGTGTGIRCPSSELGRFSVGIINGKLHLVSDSPPGATGHIDYRIAAPDPERWVTTLCAAGAQPAMRGGAGHSAA